VSIGAQHTRPTQAWRFPAGPSRNDFPANPGYTYNLVGEFLLSSSQVRGNVNYVQVPPEVYDIELKNPDGQISVLPQSLTVPSPP
jgi:hypothetical protein